MRPGAGATPIQRPAEDNPVVLYDGWCPLCVGTVRFLVRADRAGLFRFASLESAPACRLLETCRSDPDDLDAARTASTVALVDRGRLFVMSDAALRIAARLPLPWSSLVVLRVVPRALRDRAYRAVARRRHEVWGRLDSCHVPEPADLDRFL
jgi:predicted DCC family thiol-disulfide oxidoreductase YuxK